jgi:anti-anti-sigma factor
MNESRRFSCRGASVADRPCDVHAAEFLADPRASPVSVIRACGDIDVTNAAAMTEYALAHAMRCCGVVLDLRGLEFFGTEGFTALHRLSVECAHAGKGWAFVPGGVVSRLLRICDPQGTLPAADSLRAAVAAVGHALPTAVPDACQPC